MGGAAGNGWEEVAAGAAHWSRKEPGISAPFCVDEQESAGTGGGGGGGGVFSGESDSGGVSTCQFDAGTSLSVSFLFPVATPTMYHDITYILVHVQPHITLPP